MRQGLSDCNGLYPDGCEAQVGVDPANCGACGHACDAKTCEFCIAGQCTWVDGNCGACGRTCDVKRCETCRFGICGNFGGCLPGFLDCDCNPANGCEIASLLDPNNCGACGNVCPMNQNCVQGLCM